MKTKKITREKEKHKQAILNVTRHLIEVNGYSAVTLRQIATEADVSLGLIYLNFPQGKPAIVLELVQTSFQAVYNPQNFENIEKEMFPVILKNAIKLLIQNHRENEKMNHALEEAYLENEDLKIKIKQQIQQELLNFTTILEKLAEKKIITLPAVENSAVWLVSLIDGLIHRHIYFNLLNASDLELERFLVDILLKLLIFKI